MVKKTFAVMLLFCFLNLALTPSFVYAETREEKQEREDAALGRLLVVLGVLALAGYLFSPKKFTNENCPQKSKNRTRVIDFRLNFTTHDEMFAPGLVLIVRF